MRFEWDEDKAAANKRKHGVAFEEAVLVFADPLALVVPDKDFAERSLAIGRATRRERRHYEDNE